MRITKDQQTTFISVLNQFVNDKAELRLHGSRVDDTKKGGDIDLLLLVEHEQSKTTLNSKKYKILAQVKSEIGDQKIDLLISTWQLAQTDPFIKIILPTSIVLHQWKQS